MIRFVIPALLVAVAVLVSCATEPPQSVRQEPGEQAIADGTVMQVGTAHGNLYTSIGADRYHLLGLDPGIRIHVAFADTAVIMVVARDYADVPSGRQVAVLHREGLTFAIRDGDFSATYGITAGDAFTITTVPAR